ncbi:MAG: type IV pilus twitching motility protein PilT [Bacillota bacterium]|nr:type IV pilus twitching motility protein PilT [Bacillota bacterium]
MQVTDLLKTAVLNNASDIHLTVKSYPVYRINGELQSAGKINPIYEKILTPEDTQDFVRQLASPEQQKLLQTKGEIDFSFVIEDLARFRVNVFKQRGAMAMVLRVIPSKILTIEDLNLPPVISELAGKQNGLVLVTGPTGSGKSTTLAAMIDYINKNRKDHIITLEDPIEFVHQHQNSVVNQREINHDTESFASALRAALRQDPDVILVGEMRDLETISIAITAAETGHLVFGTLHTSSAASTVDRIIDVFPPHQQQQIRVQLAATIQGVIAQQLIRRIDKPGRTAAMEIMVATAAIRNLIREGKTHQINSSIQTGGKFGMQSLDNCLRGLAQKNMISPDEAIKRALDADGMRKNIHGSPLGAGFIDNFNNF